MAELEHTCKRNTDMQFFDIDIRRLKFHNRSLCEFFRLDVALVDFGVDYM